MAAYRPVYDSRHLQADCQEPGSAPEPCARQSSMGYDYFAYNPIQPNPSADRPKPTQVEKFGPNPTRSNTTNNLTTLCNQILYIRALSALTQSFQIFSTFAVVNPTQPMGQPNPWTSLDQQTDTDHGDHGWHAECASSRGGQCDLFYLHISGKRRKPLACRRNQVQRT